MESRVREREAMSVGGVCEHVSCHIYMCGDVIKGPWPGDGREFSPPVKDYVWIHQVFANRLVFLLLLLLLAFTSSFSYWLFHFILFRPCSCSWSFLPCHAVLLASASLHTPAQTQSPPQTSQTTGTNGFQNFPVLMMIFLGQFPNANFSQMLKPIGDANLLQATKHSVVGIYFLVWGRAGCTWGY